MSYLNDYEELKAIVKIEVPFHENLLSLNNDTSACGDTLYVNIEYHKSSARSNTPEQTLLTNG